VQEENDFFGMPVESSSQRKAAKDSIIYEDVLTNKANLLSGSIRTTLELSAIDHIQHQTQMPIDFVTFSMLQYIK
jgi:hypothetical protein